MNLIPLASSSAGNCTLIQSEKVNVLVDAGICRKELYRRLVELGLANLRIDAILCGHEHWDHSAHAVTLSRYFNCPLMSTPATLDELPGEAVKIPISRDGARRIQDLTITAFPVPHDAADPVGFRFDSNGDSAAVVTDLGHVSDPVIEGCANVQTLFLESNHDGAMLTNGPYASVLKRRVMSEFGHLSNDQVAGYLRNYRPVGLKRLLLGHISATANHPGLVEASVAGLLPRGVTLEILAGDRVYAPVVNYP
jgi:phosphoribosyl 1,2-cyclic phosphodiesterase